MKKILFAFILCAIQAYTATAPTEDSSKDFWAMEQQVTLAQKRWAIKPNPMPETHFQPYDFVAFFNTAKKHNYPNLAGFAFIGLNYFVYCATNSPPKKNLWCTEGRN